MAGSFAAALLDELMGRNRDANPNDKKRDLHWSDPQICKFFICGICPHDLFTNTRSDLGTCAKLHDESTKRDYEKSARCEKMGYEEDLMKFLTTVIAEADKRIQRGHERLEMAAREATIVNTPTAEQADIDAKIEAIKDRISELVAEAEQLGNDGCVDEAKEKTTVCDELRVERLQLQELRDKLVRPQDDLYKRRPMEVCDICGAMLFVDDAPQRLDDHIMGKQHMGYARIRTYMTEYQKKRDAANASRRVQRDSKSKEKDKLLSDTKTDGCVATNAEDKACSVDRGRSKSHDDRSSVDWQKRDKESRASDVVDKEDRNGKRGEENRKRDKSDERRRGEESRRHERGNKSESKEVRDRNGRRHESDRGWEHRKSHEPDRKHRDRSRDRRRSSEKSSTRSDRSRSRSRHGGRTSERSSSRGHSHRSDRNHDSRR